MTFNVAWFISAIVLLALAALFGRAAKQSLLGILVDTRERYSLTHFQVVMWTLLVLSTLLAGFISSGFDPESLEIPQELLILMGISLGSATAAGAVKSAKDAPGSRARVARGSASLAQMFQEEEGAQANKTVEVTKFQNFVFTAIAGVVYVILTAKAQTFPTFPEQVLWLIGISHGGYLGGKVPNKQ